MKGKFTAANLTPMYPPWLLQDLTGLYCNGIIDYEDYYSMYSNYVTLKGHGGAVMELHYNRDSSSLFSASTDKTVAVWDSETGELKG